VRHDVERLREELALARTMSERLWAEYREYTQTLDPARGVATPEELRRLRDASNCTRKSRAAEQALFMAENRTPGVVGSHGDYQWLSMVDCDISTLLRLCPDVVFGKYLAVTSTDSGPLRLSDQEKNDGWWTAQNGRFFRATSWSGPEYRDDWKIAYSPRRTSIYGLPNETHEECCAGFDEWYVFEQPPKATEMEVFVNWGGFRLYEPKYQEWADRLWDQLSRLAVESYIADGTVFTFATRNEGLFANVTGAFSANLPGPPL
jgi:hypothetical protein